MGAGQYRVRASECSSARGCNVLAPSCCNASYDMDIYDPTESYMVGRCSLPLSSPR